MELTHRIQIKTAWCEIGNHEVPDEELAYASDDAWTTSGPVAYPSACYSCMGI